MRSSTSISSAISLWSCLSGLEDLSDRFLWGENSSVSLGDLVRGSALGRRVEDLRGRSVLVATTDQLAAAVALVALDGVARRLILVPSDFAPKNLPYLIDLADVDAVVTDGSFASSFSTFAGTVIECRPEIEFGDYDRTTSHKTEWILLTSGTTGLPKLVVHTLESLAGTIHLGNSAPGKMVWSTFYDIRRYGGFQIFLRAVLRGVSMVLSDSQESAGDFLARAGAHDVTHISGTPSHWRQALMSGFAHLMNPQYVRLSGEIADQAILNQLQSCYRNAKVAHAFASTEAGLAFEVNDGLAGFPASLIGSSENLETKVENGSLRIRSRRAAACYLRGPVLKDEEGFVDTGDMLELRDGRYYFTGRRDGIINIGGAKVYPEEVEAVINRHPNVQMSLVRSRKNSIMGALVVAEVVLKAPVTTQDSNLRLEILTHCRQVLPSHKVPAVINFVPSLAVAETGKLMRGHA
jgi:acyl-coenzyme A synthetase/AMP-(fatty) acid ligase